MRETTRPGGNGNRDQAKLRRRQVGRRYYGCRQASGRDHRHGRAALRQPNQKRQDEPDQDGRQSEHQDAFRHLRTRPGIDEDLLECTASAGHENHNACRFKRPRDRFAHGLARRICLRRKQKQCDATGNEQGRERVSANLNHILQDAIWQEQPAKRADQDQNQRQRDQSCSETERGPRRLLRLSLRHGFNLAGHATVALQPPGEDRSGNRHRDQSGDGAEQDHPSQIRADQFGDSNRSRRWRHEGMTNGQACAQRQSEYHGDTPGA